MQRYVGGVPPPPSGLRQEAFPFSHDHKQTLPATRHVFFHDHKQTFPSTHDVFSKISSVRPMDQYMIVRKIGEGSFGRALLVKGRKDGKHYVIKEVNFAKMDRRERDEARKEVKVLSQMKHPNIVAYQDSFEG